MAAQPPKETKEEKKDEKKPDAEKRGGFLQPKRTKKQDLMEAVVKTKKVEQEFAPVVEKAIPEQLALAKSGKPAEAIENLYALEKQTRQGGDAHSTAKVAVAIVDICHSNKDLKGVINHLQVLSKRRGQLKQAITAIVQRAVTFVDELNVTTELEQKLELIAVLRTITEGKIYVENERARLTKILANIKESAGAVKEASEILQEVQVETYGSMEKKEKTDFILEQTRLCLDSKDFVRGLIIARKINPKVLSEAGFDELKLKYYELMIRYWTHEKNFLEIAKAYNAIYETPKVKSNDAQWKTALKLLSLYLVLSPHNNEQSDFINRVNLDKNLEEVPVFRDILKKLLTKELLVFPRFQALYQAEISALPPFAVSESSQMLWQSLQLRVVEHNIRTVAGYYSNISMERLAQLLTLSKEEAEKNLCDMVVAKSVWAKIDRPAGLVTFTARKDPTELLNEWSHGIGDLLELVEKTCHLIHRENVVHHIN